MHFQVPQFIETEDKIIGPLTIKQFLYVAACGFTSFLLFFVLEFWLWVIFAILLMSVGTAFAFAKVNGRNLSYFAKSALAYFWSPKVYTFAVKRAAPALQEPAAKTYQKARPLAQIASTSQMKDLGEKMATTKTAIPKRELALPPSITEAPQSTKEHYEYVRKITGDKEMARHVDYK